MSCDSTENGDWLPAVLGSINDTCIMICIMIQKSIKYYDTSTEKYQYQYH